MKLSEAGLLSSMVVEQCIGTLRSKDNKVCYLGGALVSIGELKLDTIPTFESLASEDGRLWVTLFREWPILKKHVAYPASLKQGTFDQVMEVIWTLNDTMRWTRPQISAWLATVEDQDEAERATQAAQTAIATVEAPTSTHLLDVACKG